MTTFGQMAEEVSRKLAGFTLRQDRQTHLTSNISATATTIPIQSAQNVSVGIIQIGDELIYVDSFDRNANTLSIPPYGRGYNGTPAVSHSLGDRVIISPTFPMLDIKNAINETILASFPTLYVVDSHEFPYRPARTTYPLPDDARRVLSAAWQTIGPSKEWQPVRAYRIDNMASTTEFNTNNTISIYSGVVPGRTVLVHYTAPPSVMESSTDNFSVTTGLPDSCKDVIIFGAQARLVSDVDPGRLTFGSAEADQQSQIAGRAYNAGASSSKYLLALYQQRLEEEGRKLDEMHPIRIHYSK